MKLALAGGRIGLAAVGCRPLGAFDNNCSSRMTNPASGGHGLSSIGSFHLNS